MNEHMTVFALPGVSFNLYSHLMSGAALLVWVLPEPAAVC